MARIPRPKIHIENVVASASIGKTIPIERLLEVLEASEYEPEQFPGLVFRLEKPRVASLIFRSGKIICVGARSVKEAKEAVREVVRRIKRVGVKVNEEELEIKIENVVAAVELGYELNLDALAFKLEDSEYEPEQFPGLVYRIDDPKVAFLLFSSGRVICAGAKTIAEVKRAIDVLQRKLKSFS